MPATRIAKGFSLCTAIVGSVCLLTGVGIAVCAWVLNSQLPEDFKYEVKNEGDPGVQTGRLKIRTYWWAGLIYVIPGLIGVVAGCSRSVIAMVLYLIFNLICCVCSLVVVAFSALVLIIWVVIEPMLQDNQCTSFKNHCECSKVNDETVILYGGDCDLFVGIQAIIGAMISLAAISSILSFIASYISCCSLCNKERTDNGHIIIAGGPGVYQPPTFVATANTAPYQQPSYPPSQGGYQYPPPMNTSYPPPPYQQQDFPSAPMAPGHVQQNDTAPLINNQY